MEVIDLLIKRLSRLPGLGRKSARRIAYHLLRCDQAFNRSLGQDIAELRSRVRKCSTCGDYTESEHCLICTSPTRNRSTLCVIEHPQDLAMIESVREYDGLFHVLHGVLAPLDGVGPKELGLNALIKRITDNSIQEVIVATSPTTAGDSTALYIVRLLDGSRVKVSRIASGLPVGGDFEYADKLSVARSIRERRPFPD